MDQTDEQDRQIDKYFMVQDKHGVHLSSRVAWLYRDYENTNENSE